MGSRFKSRQIDLQTFLAAAKKDVTDVRAYFEWLNSVYQRSYDHYAMVIAQVNASVDSKQAWLDFVVGVATGISVGALFEATLAAKATQLGVELLSEIGAEMVEAGVGKVVKPAFEKATILESLAPEIKQIASLKKLDELNATVLGAAVPGTFVFTAPIVLAERLSAELRVAEAGGARRMQDMEIREGYLKLMKFDLQSMQMEATLKDSEAKFSAFRADFAAKQVPTDERTEQDIWIPWIAKQNPQLSGFFSVSILLNEAQLRNHFVDIGLARSGSIGGRLNADADKYTTHNRYRPGGGAHGQTVAETAPMQFVEGAKAVEPTLAEYWKGLFLLT